jgi:hypothetical protein
MAVIANQAEISAIVRSHLASLVRYKCIVIQANDMHAISRVTSSIHDAFHEMGQSSKYLSYNDFFDSIGAASCGTASNMIFGQARESVVVIRGPLHFLDYWSEPTQQVFWQSLASFSEGLGIIFVDVIRNEGIEGPFRVVGKIADTDIRFFKSRLSLSQER